MLTTDKTKRITIEEVINHQWVRKKLNKISVFTDHEKKKMRRDFISPQEFG
jgi:hypothetical protein